MNVGRWNLIASAYENYTEQLKRRVKDEIEIGSMPNCLEEESY